VETLDAIRTRRSVRKYKPLSVKDDDLETVLESARWAPSWANTQCWRFVVVHDADMRLRLAETILSRRGLPAIREAPVVIVACAQLGESGYMKGEVATEKGDWYMFDVALAMQNMVLAAHDIGLGTVHVGYFHHKRVAELLGLPEGIVVVEMIALGYPDEDPPVPRRKEPSEIIFYERYGERRLS
jgi:nitroreductase